MALFDLFKKASRKISDNLSSRYSDPEVRLYAQSEYATRDDFKPKEYYLSELERTNSFLECFESNFEAGKYDDNYYYGHVSTRLLSKICTLYCLGAPMDDLKSLVANYFTCMKKLSTAKDEFGYNQTVYGLALFILFNLQPDVLVPYRENPLKENSVDARLDLLQNWAYASTVECSKDFYWKDTLDGAFRKGTKGFMNVVHATPDAREEAFLHYLNTDVTTYFKKQVSEWERIGENRYTYTGAFDLSYTAIAKIYGFDKTALAMSPFIAVDML